MLAECEKQWIQVTAYRQVLAEITCNFRWRHLFKSSTCTKEKRKIEFVATIRG